MDFHEELSKELENLDVTGDQSDNDIEQLINRIENDTSFDHIDGKVLSCALKLIYYCGLYRKEIEMLRIIVPDTKEHNEF